MNGNRIYLYLARRDKKGCQVVMVLQGLETAATRVADIHSLRLPPEVIVELQTIIHDRRMDWEPWVESANSYEDLRQKLTVRGYTMLPLKSNPLHSESSHNNPHIADMRHIETRKTMLRKVT